jgi:hypothetical protein
MVVTKKTIAGRRQFDRSEPQFVSTTVGLVLFRVARRGAFVIEPQRLLRTGSPDSGRRARGSLNHFEGGTAVLSSPRSRIMRGWMQGKAEKNEDGFDSKFFEGREAGFDVLCEGQH